MTKAEAWTSMNPERLNYYRLLARRGNAAAQRVVDAFAEDWNPDQPRDPHGMWQAAANAAIRATVKAEASTSSESGTSFTSAQSNKLHKQAARLHQKAAELATNPEDKATAQRFIAQHRAAIGPEGSTIAGTANTESFEKLQQSSAHEAAGLRARAEGNGAAAKHFLGAAARLHKEIGNTVRAAELEKMIGGTP